MNRRLSTIQRLRLIGVTNGYNAANLKICSLRIRKREITLGLGRLYCSGILKIPVRATRKNSLTRLCFILNKFKQNPPRITFHTSTMIPGALCPVFCAHILVRIISNNLLPRKRSRIAVISLHTEVSRMNHIRVFNIITLRNRPDAKPLFWTIRDTENIMVIVFHKLNMRNHLNRTNINITRRGIAGRHTFDLRRVRMAILISFVIAVVPFKERNVLIIIPTRNLFGARLAH